MNDIVVVVKAPGRARHILSLAQEGEKLWTDFYKSVAGELPADDPRVASLACRIIAERIKATVQAVLTADPAAGNDLNAIIAARCDRARDDERGQLLQLLLEAGALDPAALEKFAAEHGDRTTVTR